jgi:uncharacterized Zn-finger protein
MEIKIEEGSQENSKGSNLTPEPSADACMTKDDLKQEFNASEDPPKTAKKVYHCTFSSCNKYFTHRSTLVKHQRIHRGERPYQCKVCGQAFVQSSNLKRHMLVHTGEKPYNCDVCDKTFTTASNLKIHKETHKSEQSREKYTCSHCHKIFLYRSSLSKHENKCASKSEKEPHEDEGEVTHETTKRVKKEEEEGNLELSGHSASDLESPKQLNEEARHIQNLQQSKSPITPQETRKNSAETESILSRLLSGVNPTNSFITASQMRLGLPSVNSQMFDQNLLMRSLALNVELLIALKPNRCNPTQ